MQETQSEVKVTKMPVIKDPPVSEYGRTSPELTSWDSLQGKVRAAEDLSREGQHVEASQMYESAASDLSQGGRHTEASQLYESAARELDSVDPKKAIELHTKSSDEIVLAQVPNKESVNRLSPSFSRDEDKNSTEIAA